MTLGIPRFGIGLLRGGNSTDADALAWAAAVTANGGTYSAATLSKLSTLIAGMKAAGLWSKMACFAPMCGDQLAAGLIQYKSGVWGAATNVNFVSGDYSEATGLTGNGTSKYLDTNLSGTSLTTNSTHMAVYNRSAVAASGSGGTMGAVNGTNRMVFLAPNTDGLVYSNQYDGATGAVSTASAVGTPFGYLVASRISAASHAIYRNGSSVASNATSGNAVPAANFYVFAYNNIGPTNYTAHTLAAYHIGSGLSSADVVTQNTLMQTFQTALGRNV